MENGDGCKTGNEDVTIFESPRGSMFNALVAMSLWVGCIHLFMGSIATATFLIPFSISAAVALYAMLLLLSVLPADPDSKFARRVAGYIFRHVCGYFPITVFVENFKELSPDRTYIFAFEPHSVLPVGVLSLTHLIHEVPLPKSRVLASSAVFRTPFVRHIWTWMGLTAVTKNNFVSLLRAGYSCVVVPGGARETLHMVPHHEIAYLKKRKGFVRTAIEMGVPLIPVYSFGQWKIYNCWKPRGKLFLSLCRSIQYTPMFFWGVWGTPLPYRVPLHVVVGKQIEVKKNPNPTQEEVDDLHRKFIDALENLFERSRARTKDASRLRRFCREKGPPSCNLNRRLGESRAHVNQTRTGSLHARVFSSVEM